MITETQILTVLRQVVDPELGINIVDLGLVYGIVIQENQVQVAITMTTPACPVSGYLLDEAEAAIWQQVEDVELVKIVLVWNPPWHPGLMSGQAQAQLGWAS